MPPLSISRREVIAGLPLTAVAGTAFAEPKSVDAVLPFVAIGDWGRDGTSHQRDVADQIGRKAADIGSRFVVSVGDNFYENGVQSALDPQWRSSYEDIYAAQSLQTPWYVVLGNHDYKGVPQAQLDYALSSPRWRLPSRTYTVSGASLGTPHVDMFFLDTSPLVHKYRDNVHSAIAQNVSTQDVQAQLAWLDNALASSQAPWKLVFGHHTIYSGGSAHGNTTEMVALIDPILVRHGVQAYVNGHEHDLQHLRIGAVDYICTGAGSEVRPTGSIAGTRFCLSRSGFAALKLSRDALDLEFCDYQGASVYHASLPRIRTA